MQKTKVYPVWIKEMDQGSYYGKSFDFHVDASGDSLDEVLDRVSYEAEIKMNYLDKEGLGIPTPGSKKVDKIDDFDYMELFTCSFNKNIEEKYQKA